MDSHVHLTPRKIEVLRWISEGKTASETAIILGLSEHRVVQLIGELKLIADAVNTPQLVAKAMRAGWIN